MIKLIIAFLLTLSLGVTSFAEPTSSETDYPMPSQETTVHTNQIENSTTDKPEEVAASKPSQKKAPEKSEQQELSPVTEKPKKEEESKPSEQTKKETTSNHSENKREKSQTAAEQGVLSMEQEVVQLVNLERSKHGLAPLELDEKVTSIARKKSADMRDRGYFNHQSPTYGSPFDMLTQFGVTYRTAAENIAAGYSSPEAVVKGWMNSEGHRKNILNPSFTKIGIGHVKGGLYGNYWTQLFVGE